MIIETIHVTDMFRVAALRLALRNKQVINVVGDDGETYHGMVESIVNSNDFMWTVNIERVVVA